LAVQLGVNLAYRLSSASGGRDDVAGSRTAAAPVLLRRTVNSLLGAGGGVYGGHQALGDAERLVQNLSDRSQAVGGAGSVGNKGHILGVGVLVNAHNEHRGVVLGRCRHDNLLCAAVDVRLCLLLGQENAGGLNNIVNAVCAPRNVLRIHLSMEQNLLAVHSDGVVVVLDGTVITAVHGVILEHIRHVVRSHERIVYHH